MRKSPLAIRPADLLAVDRSAIDLTKPTIGLAIVLVALILFSTVGPFGFTAAIGAVLAVAFDGGGPRRRRLAVLGVFGVLGALATYLGNSALSSIGGSIVVVFIVTLLCGMALAFGPYAGKMAFFLNLWTLIALSLATVIDAPLALALGFLCGAGAAAVLLMAKQAAPEEAAAAPAWTLAPLRTHLSPRSPILHFALSRAVIAAFAMWLGWAIAPAHPYWIAMTFLIVLVPDRAQAARTSWQRAIGTIIGVALAGFILGLGLTPTTLLLVWLLVILVMLAVQGVNYVLYASILTLCLLLLYQLLEADVLFNGMERLVTTLLGIGLALGVVALLEYLARRAAGGQSAAAQGEIDN